MVEIIASSHEVEKDGEFHFLSLNMMHTKNKNIFSVDILLGLGRGNKINQTHYWTMFILVYCSVLFQK